MIAFYDTSALVKLYHPEPGSLVIRAFNVKHRNALAPIVSALAKVEMHSALLQKARLKQAEYAEIKKIVTYCDLYLERFKIINVGVEVLQTATQLIDQFAHQGSLRSHDSIQLASAIFANQMAPIERFVSSDKNQLAIASRYFPIFNPETDSP